jgi:branched-chain amino acid transport system permease protein
MPMLSSGKLVTTYQADLALCRTAASRYSIAALVVVFIGIVPFVAHEYYLSILNLILIAIVGAIGLNLLVGNTGQVSIGHGAFMSVGAYTAANLIVRLDAPFWLAIPAGGLMAAVVGAFVGIPSLRIRGIYLVISTLAAQLIIEWLINHVHAISGGAQASIDVPRPRVFGQELKTQLQFYFFLMVFVVVAIVAALNLMRTRIGRAFVAIRDQDIAAEIMGINISRYKLVAFTISSFYAGVTGVLYTYYLGIANYEQFQLGVSIDYLAMVIIGGLGSVRGSILGALFVTLLPIVCRLLLEGLGHVFSVANELVPVIPHLRLTIFGVLIIVFLVAEPDGLNRLWLNARNYLRTWPYSH